MAEDHSSTEFDFGRILEFARTDQNGPGQRTARVYEYLVKADRFTNWDILCFCAEYVASMVGTLPWLEPPARWLIRLIYMAHYIRFETVAWQDSQPISESGSSIMKDFDGDATSGR